MLALPFSYRRLASARSDFRSAMRNISWRTPTRFASFCFAWIDRMLWKKEDEKNATQNQERLGCGGGENVEFLHKT